MDLIPIILIILLVVGVPAGWSCGGPPWGGGILGLLLLILLLYLLLGHARAAEAHDWFTPTTNAKGQHCCGGSDCKEIPQEWIDQGAIRPIPDGFSVRLSADQAYAINGYTHTPVSEDVTGARVQPSEGPAGSGYAICIVSGAIRCFFAPLSY